jgi:hypothetical protein
MLTRCITLASLGLVLLGSRLAAAPATQVWSTPLGSDAKWHQLTALGSLLVGTDGALLCLSPDDGKVVWKRDDIRKSNRTMAREIPGTPLLACPTFDGMMNSKITPMVMDVQTGKTLWTAPQMLGQFLGTIAVPERNLAIFVVNTMDRKDNGVYFLAHDLTTGAAKWASKFTKSGGIPLHLADNSGKFIPTMDLSGYHDPVVDGNDLYVGYLGVHCVDLETGAVKWGVEFPPGNKGLKKTYAPLRIDGTGFTAGAAAVCTRSTAGRARRSGRAIVFPTTPGSSRPATTPLSPRSKWWEGNSSPATAAISPTAKPPPCGSRSALWLWIRRTESRSITSTRRRRASPTSPCCPRARPWCSRTARMSSDSTPRPPRRWNCSACRSSSNARWVWAAWPRSGWVLSAASPASPRG